MSVDYALSLKQPWAALVLHGLKTVEIRRWPTHRRGRILLHAARVPDPRPFAWALVPDEARATTDLRGGVIGAVELMACVRYVSVEAFRADQALHLNDPDWFRPPALFGFRLAHAEQLPFRRFPGNVRFFTVPRETRAEGT